MVRVIVVEDSPTQAQQLAFILEKAGFDVVLAPEAETAFRRLVDEHFDVVLSDLNLPGDSGFDLCRRLKADPRLRLIPIIVCTIEADPANVLRGLEAGADGFITKRRPASEILKSIDRVLTRPCAPEPSPRTKVVFLGQEFELAAGREQLLDILLSAFEDVVHLNAQSQESAVAMRATNRKLEQRNLELQRAVESEHRAHEERKRAETHLIQNEKLAALGRMVAGVAHEINNPLAFVRNNLAILQRDLCHLRDLIQLYQEADGSLDQSRPELLARIQALAEQMDLAYVLMNVEGLASRSSVGLKRIEQIVNDLRDFARLQEAERQEIDLNEGIATTLAIARVSARPKQVEIVTDLEPLPRITCYPAKLNQVVLNLLTNAIDASPRGGVVTIRTRPDSGGGVTLAVIDAGKGIDPSIQDKVFEPFFTTKPIGQGTGLGLSIVHGIVELHGGRIEFESKPDHGTRFTVHLPLQSPSPTPELPDGIIVS